MKGRLAFTGAQHPSTVGGERVKSGHGARGVHLDDGEGVTWYAHLYAVWRRSIVTAAGVELRPFLTDEERKRAGAEFAVIGRG